jgi:hypothetical protein
MLPPPVAPRPRLRCRQYVIGLIGWFCFCVDIPLDIASISAVEGQNWRHGDIEDLLKTIACISGHKWTSTMIKRVYFGNWLRD